MKKRGPIYCAMLIIGLLEMFALSKGINGVLLSLTLAILAGLGGVTTGWRFRK